MLGQVEGGGWFFLFNVIVDEASLRRFSLEISALPLLAQQLLS